MRVWLSTHFHFQFLISQMANYLRSLCCADERCAAFAFTEGGGRWGMASCEHTIWWTLHGLKRSCRGALLAWALANSTDTWHRNLKSVGKNTATRGAFWINLTDVFFSTWGRERLWTPRWRRVVPGDLCWEWTSTTKPIRRLLFLSPTVRQSGEVSIRQPSRARMYCAFCKQILTSFVSDEVLTRFIFPILPLYLTIRVGQLCDFPFSHGQIKVTRFQRQATGEPLVNTSDIFDIGGPGDFATFKLQRFGW